MRLRRGQVAVVTGAAQGMGAALAEALAARGVDVALADVKGAELDAVAARCAAAGVRATAHRCDMGVREAVFQLAADVEAAHGKVSMLFNNAGVVALGSFERDALEHFEWVLNIDLLGVVWATKAFLPMLTREAEAYVVNLSSLAGLAAGAGCLGYTTAKFGVRGFSEGLADELRADPRTARVRVMVVHPGFVSTDIGQNARIVGPVGDPVMKTSMTVGQPQMVAAMRRCAAHSPASAARAMLRGVERGETRLLLTPESHVLDLVIRLLPRWWKHPLVLAPALLVMTLLNLVARVTNRLRVPDIGADRALCALIAFLIWRRRLA